ncbi:MAG: chromate transporter, partial [Finegoldia magna]|nr:chromate transporter [Finegoldia magna]
MIILKNIDLFKTLLKINAVTFGGGYTIVPIIRDEFVKNKKIIDDDEMMKIIALAQSCPGAMAINTSILLGYRINKTKGAIASVLAATLPCLVIISIVSLIYNKIHDNPFINMMLISMSGAISAILLLTVVDLAKSNLKKDRALGIGIMILAFVMGFVFNINVA